MAYSEHKFKGSLFLVSGVVVALMMIAMAMWWCVCKSKHKVASRGPTFASVPVAGISNFFCSTVSTRLVKYYHYRK